MEEMQIVNKDFQDFLHKKEDEAYRKKEQNKFINNQSIERLTPEDETIGNQYINQVT